MYGVTPMTCGHRMSLTQELCTPLWGTHLQMRITAGGVMMIWTVMVDRVAKVDQEAKVDRVAKEDQVAKVDQEDMMGHIVAEGQIRVKVDRITKDDEWSQGLPTNQA